MIKNIICIFILNLEHLIIMAYLKFSPLYEMTFSNELQIYQYKGSSTKMQKLFKKCKSFVLHIVQWPIMG